MHVLRAWIGGVDARGVGASVPIVDRGVVLHAGIAAEIGALGDHAQKIARLVGRARLAVGDKFGLPFAVFLHRLHELVGHAHGIVGVLKKHAAVSWTIEAGIIAGFDQRPGFFLFFNFTLDEILDVRMIDVQNHHLGGAPGFTAGLDHSGGSVSGLHERHRARCRAAAGQLLLCRTNRRKIHSGTGTAFKDNPFLAVPIENRIHRVFHREDKARRTLRLRFDAAVEPHRAVKTGLLVQQDMGQFIGKALGIVFRGKVAIFASPTGDGIDHSADHLADAMFPLRRPKRSSKVFRHHHLGRHQRPGFGDLDVGLLKNHLAFFVSNRGGAELPFDFIVGMHTGFGEIT